MVEQRTENPRVGGSIPPPGITSKQPSNASAATVSATNIHSAALSEIHYTADILNFYHAIGFTPLESVVIRASKGEKQIILSGCLPPRGSQIFALRECTATMRAGETARDYLPDGKFHADGAAYLRWLGADGYDIFAYPNHLTGGLGNRHSQKLSAIFYEIDDLPLDQQWQKLWDLVGDTELIPAAIVFTGGKSLHCYFKSEDLTQEQWTLLNRLLTIRQDSDPAICNVGRAMRLPGVPRVKNGETREVALQEFNLDAPRYTYDELFTILGGDIPYGLDDDRWRQWRAAKSPAEKYQALHAAPPPPPAPRVAPAADLSDLSGVSGRVRIFDLIPSSLTGGTGQGGRNERALVVARHALATEDWARGITGLSLDDDARQVFDSFCQSCSPPLSQREAEKVWKSAARGTYSLDAEAIEIKERIVAKILGVPTSAPKSKTRSRRKHEFTPTSYTTLTPTHRTTGGYLPDIEPRGLTAISAGMGSGKTHLLEKWARTTTTPDNLLIGSKVALIRQTCHRTGADNYQDIPNEIGKIRGFHIKSSTLAICLNSLLRLDYENLGDDFKNIWIDEPVGVIKSILFDNTEGLADNRLTILKRTQDLLGSANFIGLLDANLSDSEVKLFSELAPHLPVSVHRHSRQHPTAIKIKVADGTDKDGRYRRDAAKNQKYRIFKALAKKGFGKQEKIVVVSDSAELLESLAKESASILGEELGKGYSPSIRLITGTTSGEPWARDFLEDPDNHLDGVRILLLSPTAESGVNILTYFDKQFGIFSGLPISASAIAQLIGRPRHVGEREVFIPAFVAGIEVPAFNAAAEERRIMRRWEDEGRRVGDSTTISEIDPAYIRYAAYREWLDKKEKQNLAEAVAGYLQNSGYEPELIPCLPELGDDIDKRLKEVKEEIRQTESTAVADAVPPCRAEYEALKQGNATIENQRRIRRYEFEKNYPGLAITPSFAYAYLYERVGEALTLSALLSLSPDDAREYLRIARKRRAGCPWLVSHTAARYDALRKITTEMGDLELASGDPLLERLGEKARKSADKLGLAVHKMQAAQAVREILQLGGFTLSLARRSGNTRFYRLGEKPPIAPDLWRDMVAATTRRVIATVEKARQNAEKAAEMPAAETTQSASPPPIEDLKGRGDAKNEQVIAPQKPPVEVIVAAATTTGAAITDVAITGPTTTAAATTTTTAPVATTTTAPIATAPVATTTTAAPITPITPAATDAPPEGPITTSSGAADTWIGVRVRSTFTGLWGRVCKIVWRWGEWCADIEFDTFKHSVDPVPLRCLVVGDG